MQRFLSLLFLLSILLVPIGTEAQGCEPGVDPNCGIVPCTDDCTFEHFVVLVNNIIHFLVIVISIPLAAITFAFAGFKYVTAAGNETQIREAHGMFTKVVIGLIIALSAFLIVELITSNLLGSDVNTFLESNFISG